MNHPQTTPHLPTDRTRVSMSEPLDVTYWTRHFGVSADRLHEAKQAVGSAPDAVADYLKK